MDSCGVSHQRSRTPKKVHPISDGVHQTWLTPRVVIHTISDTTFLWLIAALAIHRLFITSVSLPSSAIITLGLGLFMGTFAVLSLWQAWRQHRRQGLRKLVIDFDQCKFLLNLISSSSGASNAARLTRCSLVGSGTQGAVRNGPVR